LLKSFLWERWDTNKYLLLWDRIAGIAADEIADKVDGALVIKSIADIWFY
jgi:hypothetical protein